MSTISETAGINPATIKLLEDVQEAARQSKAAQAIEKELRAKLQIAYDLGELDELLQDGKGVWDLLQISVVQRNTWKYSNAVSELQEQEQFNGTATKQTSSSLRLSIRDRDAATSTDQL